MRKVSPALAACAITITCIAMAGSSVSGRALGVAPSTADGSEAAPLAAAAVDDQQLRAPGITPAAAKAAAEVPAIVQTDKYDYQPGETALISGSGFAPGENVTLKVDHANGLVDGDGHLPFTVLADGSGNIDA